MRKNDSRKGPVWGRKVPLRRLPGQRRLRGAGSIAVAAGVALLFLCGAIVLQGAFGEVLKLPGGGVNFILLVVIFFGLWRGSSVGAGVGFAAGIAQDVVGQSLLGTNALVMLGGGWIAGVLGHSFFYQKITFQMAVTLLVALGCQLLSYLSQMLFGGSHPGGGLRVVMLPGAAINALLAPISFWVMRRLTGWK